MSNAQRLPMPLITVLFSALFPATSFAGHESGNGGGGVVCSTNGTTTVSLLDLWEGEKLRSLNIRRSPSDIPSQISASIDVLRRYKQEAMATFVKDLALSLYQEVEIVGNRFLPDGVAIAPPADAKNGFIQRNCSLQGIALYDDDFLVLDVDKVLYDSLSSTDKAALFFHEAVYRYLRINFSAQDSRLARTLTACSFSTEPCPELDRLDGLPLHGPRYLCRTEGDSGTPIYSFYLFPIPALNFESEQQYRFQFVSFKGIPLPIRTYLDSAIHFENIGQYGRIETRSPVKAKEITHSTGVRPDIGLRWEIQLSTYSQILSLDDQIIFCDR